MTPDDFAAKYCGPDGRLTDAGRAYVGQFAKRTPGKTSAGWPQHVFKQWNGCSEPCDMWTGPCACGAYHLEGR